MAQTRTRVAAAALTAGILGAVALTVAPYAGATDDNDFCNKEQSFAPQVETETLALQSAASKRSWQWGDPPMQDAANAILSDYPGLLAINPFIFAPVDRLLHQTEPYVHYGPDNLDTYVVHPQFPQFNNDVAALQAAMNEQLTTLQHQDTPSDVLPDAAATLAATKALDNDCHVGR